jgi:glycosyltransferase involved in cell wall biosynthesis
VRLLVLNMAMDLDVPSQEFIGAWVRALAERVDRVEVITMRAGRVEAPRNVRVHSLGKERGYSEPRRVLEFYRHLGRVLGEGRIDACFSHMAPIFTVLAAPLLGPRGVPIVTWYAHPSLTVTLRLAHHLSTRVVTSVAPAYPYRVDKLIPVGQGIDTDLFAPDGTPPEKPPMILCVGRLSPVKDHPTLLRALSLIRKASDRPFRAVVVGAPARAGDEAYVRLLREQVASLGLGEVVTLQGAVAMHDLPAWYRRCTVHVNLTPIGFGDKVAWEAMSCGRPCVAANEGFRDSLAAHASRLLFPHGDAETLARRLEWVLSLPEEDVARIGSDLRDGVVRSHSLAGLASRLVDLFRELAADRTTQRPR